MNKYKLIKFILIAIILTLTCVIFVNNSNQTVRSSLNIEINR